MPQESKWAEIREAQTLALSLPKTGQAVIIDIGEAKNIHPKNKKDVGKRLALHALKYDYGQKDIVADGPTFQSMKTEKNKVIITFDNIGSGLVSKDNNEFINGFALAGKDKKFVWAKAKISGNSVIVWSDNLSHPVAVRYGWSDNPGYLNLYNKEGLPACPFRTALPQQ
jgi:sialate O-acetylesterase